MSVKTLELICLGRASVDLYGQQIGDRLQDVASFAKSLGGSSCNIAFGAARLGLAASMLTRVGDEQFGQFIREELSRSGCDVSHVVTDPNRLTALAILSIKTKDQFPLLFYRTDCADMAIDISDFDEAYIASSKALLITGTHFSTPPCRPCCPPCHWLRPATSHQSDPGYRLPAGAVGLDPARRWR